MSDNQIRSIRFRLICWLVIPLTFVSLITLVYSSERLSMQANEVFDRTLLAMAQSIEQRIHIRNGVAELDMPYFSLDVMESASAEKVFYRVERADHQLLAGFKGLQIRTTQQQTIRFYNTQFAGSELRAVQLVVKGPKPTSTVIISVAESLQGRQAFSHELLFIALSATLFTLFLSVITVITAVQQGLSPLRKIRNAISQRSVNDLRVLSEPVPKEIEPLVESINYLISRIRDNIDHIQHFNADVSHQLRTPLAEIKTLAELARTRPDQHSAEQSLLKIEQQTDFLSRTTQQLLSYAKTSQGLLDNKHLQTIDLVALGREFASQQVPVIYQQQGELEFCSPKTSTCMIEGDKVLLTGLLKNLVDNALRYGQHPIKGSGSQITISVCADKNSVYLSVADQGRGIPANQLSHVTERFVRLDKQHSGTGLGLAIVEQICDFHQAKLSLENNLPHGLKVTINFQRIT